jgi:hypothetical protein
MMLIHVCSCTQLSLRLKLNWLVKLVYLKSGVTVNEINDGNQFRS